MGCQMETMEPNSDHKMEKIKLANIHFKDCPRLTMLNTTTPNSARRMLSEKIMYI